MLQNNTNPEGLGGPKTCLFILWNLCTMLLAVPRAQAKDVLFAQKLRDALLGINDMNF